MTDPKTTVEATHTPGPWFIDDRHAEIEIVGRPGNGYRRLGEVGQWTVATIDGDDLLPDGQVRANARRIVACVNALEGYNPDAVADVVAALEAAAYVLAEAGRPLTAAAAREALARLLKRNDHEYC